MSSDLRLAVQREVERLSTSLEDQLVELAEKLAREAVEELAAARDQLQAELVQARERVAALEWANGQATLGRRLAEARLDEEVKRRVAIEKQLDASRLEPACAQPGVPPPPPHSIDRAPQFAASRQAHRVKLQTGSDVLVDGVSSVLVDISAFGAQVLSPTTLRPNRIVRLMLRTGTGTCAAEGRIVWAQLESARAEMGAQYRAGMQFTNTDRAAIDALVSQQPAGQAAIAIPSSAYR